MKKLLTVALAAAIMLAMTFALASCGDGQCDGSEVGEGANQLSRKEPTCTSQGYIEYECSKGGDAHVVILEALGHENIKWFTDVLPTCTTNGSEHSECTVCGEQVETKIIPMTGHNESDWIIDKAATCVDNGEKHTECSVCNEVISTQVIEAPGHNLDEEWKVSVPVTCLTDGEIYQECTECGDKWYEVVKAVGHIPNEEFTVRREATCLVEGYEELECSECSEVLEKRAIPQSDHHKIDKIVVAPTCTENGTKQVVCRDCEEIFGTETAFATGHDEQLVVDVAPTCTEPGIGHVACPNCGLTYDKQPLDPLGHAIEDGVCVNLGCDVYERNITVVYKSPSLATLPESYSVTVYSDYDFVPEIPVVGGFYTVVETEIAENGRDAVYSVVYLKNYVKLITSVETIEVSVPYGTFASDLNLPLVVKGYTADGEEVNVQARWTHEGYDPKFNSDSQVLTGKVLLDGQVNLYYLTVKEITAIVTVGKNFVNVNDAIIGEIPYNTPFAELGLPETVVAFDNRGERHELAVRWSSVGYNPKTAGIQTITGELIDEDGYVLREPVAKAHVVVVKNIVSADDVDFGLVVYGTKFINAGIPSTVKCYAEDGTVVELGVTWNTSLYDPNKLGKQTLTGKISGIDGYKVTDVEVNLNIDIRKTIVEIPCTPAGYIDLGFIERGTLFADIPNFHNQYSVIQVVTNDGTTRNVRVIWDSSSYNPNNYNENTIIGHLELTDDLWIEDTTIIARYTAIG